MTSPYINTKLYSEVMLNPNQFDNKIYLHLKNNLIYKLEGKCYKHYGYIVKIFDISEYKDGEIRAEDPMSSAIYKVKFSCRLAVPIINKQIICKIERMNKMLIRAANGPIKILIKQLSFNKDVFFIDQNRNLRYRAEGKSRLLIPGNFVKLTINSLTIRDTDDRIFGLGFINAIATDEEVKQFYNEQYEQSGDKIEYDEYVANKDSDIEKPDETKLEEKLIKKPKKTKKQAEDINT